MNAVQFTIWFIYKYIYTNMLSVYMLNCILYLQLILLWKVHCNVNFVDIDACCPVLVCMVLFDVSSVVAAYFIPPPPKFLWTFYFQLKLSSKHRCKNVCMSLCVWERGEERLLYISEVHGIKQAEINRKCNNPENQLQFKHWIYRVCYKRNTRICWNFFYLILNSVSNLRLANYN